MCGQFTAMVSWRRVVSFSRPFAAAATVPDERVTHRRMVVMPVIVWDTSTKQRRVLPKRQPHTLLRLTPELHGSVMSAGYE